MIYCNHYCKKKKPTDIKMKNIFFIISLLFVFAACFFSCTKDKGKLPFTSTNLCDSLQVKFSASINPIIQAKCVNQTCHMSGGTGGDFTTYNGVSAKADAPAGNGSLRKRIIGGINPPMPPGGPLLEDEQKKIDCWLKAGAPNN